jgi:maltoporin
MQCGRRHIFVDFSISVSVDTYCQSHTRMDMFLFEKWLDGHEMQQPSDFWGGKHTQKLSDVHLIHWIETNDSSVAACPSIIPALGHQVTSFVHSSSYIYTTSYICWKVICTCQHFDVSNSFLREREIETNRYAHTFLAGSDYISTQTFQFFFFFLSPIYT